MATPVAARASRVQAHPDDEIGPVTRALAVLEALNLRPHTPLRILHTDTGLPKATLVRLLRSLRAAGYVEQISSVLGYRVTARVVHLSAGVRFRDRVVDAAVEPMRRFTREHRWPLYLGMLAGGAIQVRHSTIADSPLSTEPAAYYRSFPILSSALGHAYLAFCPDAERSALLRALAASDRAENAPAREPRTLLATLRSVRRKGYALTPPDRSRYLGLAVPVMYDAAVPACLSLRFLRRALSVDEAVARYLGDLQRLAREIGGAAGPSATASSAARPPQPHSAQPRAAAFGTAVKPALTSASGKGT